MLYPLRLVSEDKLSLSPAPEALTPAARFLRLMYLISELFDESPAVLYIPGGSTLTLLYRNVAYTYRDILDAAGPEAAALAGAASLRFSGTTAANRETAELTLRVEDGGVTACRRSLSGEEFDQLSGLGIQVDWEDVDMAAHLAAIAAGLPHDAPCGVFDPEEKEFLRGSGLLVPTSRSLFAYFAWESVPPRQFLLFLSLKQKAELWYCFLKDRWQPLEFEWLWESYSDGEPIYLLEWELALRVVLEDLGFRLERDDARFQVLDGAGEVRRFDFAKGGAAEKLFLKLLFPLNTK